MPEEQQEPFVWPAPGQEGRIPGQHFEGLHVIGPAVWHLYTRPYGHNAPNYVMMTRRVVVEIPLSADRNSYGSDTILDQAGLMVVSAPRNNEVLRRELKLPEHPSHYTQAFGFHLGMLCLQQQDIFSVWTLRLLRIIAADLTAHDPGNFIATLRCSVADRETRLCTYAAMRGVITGSRWWDSSACGKEAQTSMDDVIRDNLAEYFLLNRSHPSLCSSSQLAAWAEAVVAERPSLMQGAQYVFGLPFPTP